MSTLSTASTRAEIEAAYDDNASYAEDASPTKARAFITACRLLIRITPKRAAKGGRGEGELELGVEFFRQEIRDAQRWLALNGTSAQPIKHPSFENFRS